MFDIDTKDFRQLKKDLRVLRRRALPHSAREALNTAAFRGREFWQEQMDHSFILRNRWTKRSVRVDKARGANIDRMQAVLGSVADYMAIQEHGGSDEGAIPAPGASGEQALPRRRLVTKSNKLRSIQLARRGKKGSRAQRNAISIRIAKKAGKKFVFLETKQGASLFRLMGGKRKVRTRRVWILPTKTSRIRAQPTLGPALARVERALPEIHRAALIKQLRFNRIFGH